MAAYDWLELRGRGSRGTWGCMGMFLYGGGAGYFLGTKVLQCLDWAGKSVGTVGIKGASLLDCLRKMLVDPAFTVDFKSCVRYCLVFY
nr:hypothetical protein [Tanacetum cinerariifolium]